jgi:FdhD protein
MTAQRPPGEPTPTQADATQGNPVRREMGAGAGVALLRVQRVSGEQRSVLDDAVAVEEPLEIRLAGETVAVTMRTPGHDHELVLGFLLAEGIIRSRDEVGGIAHCGRPGESGNVIDVSSAPGHVIEWEPEGAMRRATLITSACGVCGRRSIDDLLARVGEVRDDARFTAHWIARLTEQLVPRQANFAASGGVHAAALWDNSGQPYVLREDVGRHNAVDKVMGRAALDGRLPATGMTLVVSGRASFELVQKAAVARVAMLVSVSAPSSLAVAAAQRSGITLVGFARGDRFNVYAGEHRITGLAQ